MFDLNQVLSHQLDQALQMGLAMISIPLDLATLRLILLMFLDSLLLYWLIHTLKRR